MHQIIGGPVGFMAAAALVLGLVLNPAPSMAVPVRDFDPSQILRVPAYSPLVEALRLLNAGRYDAAIAETRAFLATTSDSAQAFEILGAALVMKGEMDQGFEALKKAVALDPKQSSAITKMGDVYMARRDFPEAKEAFLKAIQITPSDHRAHQRLGLLFEREGQNDLAISHYEKGIEGTPPGYVGVKVNLASLYNEARRYDKTLMLLGGLVDESTGNPTALVVLGTAYYALNQTDEAIRTFEKAKMLEPDSDGVALSLGIAYRQKGLYSESLNELKRVVRAKPEWSTGHFQMGETLFVMQAYDKALSSYGKAENLSPNPRLIKERTAEVYIAQGKMPEAIAIYIELTRSKDTDIKAFDLLGTAYQVSGQLELAEQTFSAMRREYSKNAFSYYRSGLFFGFVRNYDQAILQFNQALALVPQDVMALRALSVAYRQRGDLGKSIETARKIVDIRPENVEDRFYLATLIQNAEGNKEAIQLYQAIISQDSGHVLAQNNLAMLLLEEGDVTEALEIAQKAAGMAPKNAMALDTLGWILFKSQKYKDALKVLNEAASLMPGHPVILYHLGVTQHAAGDVGAARQNLSKALQISPDFKGAEEARILLNH